MSETLPQQTKKGFPYVLSALAVAVSYWMLDSSIHFILFQEPQFEFIPNESNELWMRCMVVLLIVIAGVLMRLYTQRLLKSESEKLQLQIQLNQTLQRELDAEHARFVEMYNTMAEVQDNVNNFLNRMQVFMLEIEEKEALPQSSLNYMQELIQNTSTRLRKTGESRLN